jgi:hypothetical protein
MEVKGRRYEYIRKGLTGLVFLFLCTVLYAQPKKPYTIKKGRMYIELHKNIRPTALDSFVAQYDLVELDLKTFLKTNNADSLLKLGWALEDNNASTFTISKAFEPSGDVFKRNDKLLLEDSKGPLFPATNNGIVYGFNRFRNKSPFFLQDSIVRFFLRGYQKANKVMLAGSFNNWKPDQLAMQKTDSGWIYHVKLAPGKYWYKFVADGQWMVDRDNHSSENDGEGNVNSVYYKTNVHFRLPGFTNARKAFLSGSFNNWKPNGLEMQKTASGWELPLYLSEGTYTYKYVADGNWITDPINIDKVPNEHNDYNSVIRLGKPYLFKLNGFQNANRVMLAGSFNKWREFEFAMNKTPDGWQLPFYLGAGNHEYKFKVDGKWISDPANPMTSPSSGNSYLIIEPNYTFRLKGLKDAKAVYLAGNFNQWDPKAYAMKKEGDDWIFPVHLSVGKHRYKFVVDGKWIIDPNNKLWEQNEFGTGNSVLWIER